MLRCGLTYDLRDDYLAMGFDKEACAEFDSIETIDAIDALLKSRGFVTERIESCCGTIESAAIWVQRVEEHLGESALDEAVHVDAAVEDRPVGRPPSAVVDVRDSAHAPD